MEAHWKQGWGRMSFDCSNLKLYRKQHGFTQEYIAEKIGVSRQAVAKWERGETVPSIENVMALADLYEISVDSLVRNLVKVLPESNDGKYMFGITRIDDKRRIELPKKACEVFTLNEGNALLLLGDEARGIALVKVAGCEETKEENSFKKNVGDTI